MIKKIAGADSFRRNIVIVFAGTTLASFLNLVCRTLIAHKLLASQFAAFDTLLVIFTWASAPVSAIQMAITRYAAKYNALHQAAKIKFLLSAFLKKTLLIGLFMLLFLLILTPRIISVLKIPSAASGYILAILISFVYITPVLSGGVQGLEYFNRYTAAVAAAGILKLILTFLLLFMGYQIVGAMGALLASVVISLFLFYIPLKEYISFNFTWLHPESPGLPAGDEWQVKSRSIVKLGYLGRSVTGFTKAVAEHGEILKFIFPIALASFCFIALVDIDMVWVKYFFTPDESGLYSLARTVGKIFLFLPGAVSIVMFPRTAGLSAQKLETVTTLKRSLFYGFCLCALAVICYNMFPISVLKVLTGKSFSDSVTLGRLFSISMTFYALVYIQIFYFLSIKDLRFLKYLVSFMLLQNLLIYLIHGCLINIQLILCFNGLILFLVYLFLMRNS